MIILVVFSIIYGALEWELLQRAKSTGPKVILGHFSLYHFYMLILFLLVAAPDIHLIPLMILIEDLSYRLAKGEWVQKGDWLEWKLGGFYLAGMYLPVTYILMAILSIMGIYAEQWIL